MARRGKRSRREESRFPTKKAVGCEIERLLKKRRRQRFFRARVVCLAAALLIGWWASQNVFLVVTVRDGAMSPTVEAGSTVICLRQSFLNALVCIVPADAVQPRRGGAYLLAYEGPEDADEPEGAEDKPLLPLRRVLGLPGDVIDVRNGAITVNGEAVGGDGSGGDRVYPVTVRSGGLFLAGDHRAVSVDSFQRSFGMPGTETVVARPVAVVWPLYEIGLVN